jgi:putative ABC transport system substrate-binding protein
MKKQIFASGFAAAVAANPALAEETNDPHRISKGSVFPPQLCWALAAMLRHRALAATAASLMLFASQAGGQERVHRVGVLAQSEIPEQTEAWPRGLREHGWVVGRNLQIEYRDYYDRPELIPALAAELDALRPDVIVTSGPLPALAVHSAAPVIPLVFLVVADPIALGLVDSLARPGGSATGMATNVPEGFVGKKLQLLKELVPRASRIAVLINPMNPIHQHFRPELPEIGRLLGATLVIVEASGLDQLESAFDAASKQGAEAVDLSGDPYMLVRSLEVVAIVARSRLPAVYTFRQNVLDGGLMSFGASLADFWRRAAGYVDKILTGEKPADLPVWQPTGYHLAVNLKTAAALGITVPPLILSQADEVIE